MPKDPKPPQFASWNDHLAAYRKKHPGVGLKEAMKAASATYSKKPKAPTPTK
jgi:hypothetical protein